MASIGGRPLLEHQILLAKRYGISSIMLLVGYGADTIREYFGDGSRWGVNIRYREEPEPLGTAGAVLEALGDLEERFLVMYGDTMFNVNLERFGEAHVDSGAPLSLLVHPNDHPHDSDLVELDQEDRVGCFHPYPHSSQAILCQSGKRCVVHDRSTIFGTLCRQHGISGFRQALFPAICSRKGSPLHGYRSREYIKDAGTPERLDRVTADFESGRIERGSLTTSAAPCSWIVTAL